MTDHTSKQFEAELESIRTRVLQMGGMVELQIAKAMEALGSGNVAALEEVVAHDHHINLLELDLDDACIHIIAKRQPAANDLRLVMSVIKAITDLERIGDEAKKIAKMGKRLHAGDAVFVPRVELRHAASLAVDMLRKALDAFARLDSMAAAEVVRQDKEVDAEFKGIIRQLITFVMEDPRTISRGIDILFMAKAIERIGDHAKNIAEYVVFMDKGTDVRHTGVANIERAAKAD